MTDRDHSIAGLRSMNAAQVKIDSNRLHCAIHIMPDLSKMNTLAPWLRPYDQSRVCQLLKNEMPVRGPDLPYRRQVPVQFSSTKSTRPNPPTILLRALAEAVLSISTLLASLSRSDHIWNDEPFEKKS